MKYKLRHPAHWLAGIIIPFSALLSPSLPLTLAFLFVSYEGFQGWRKKDNAYLDIFETTTAAFITTAALVLWQVLA